MNFLFQSLIGFKINWNIQFMPATAKGLGFQSLIGFKINWNEELQQTFLFLGRVSIPNRV